MEKKDRLFKAYKYLEMNGLIKSQEDLSYKMKASRSNISSALSGRESVLTDKFLMRFCNAFPGLFNLEWLLNGDGEMLLEKAKPEPYTQAEQLIALAASLIQETEKIRHQLAKEIEDVQLLKVELRSAIAMLSKPFSADTQDYPSYLAEDKNV